MIVFFLSILGAPLAFALYVIHRSKLTEFNRVSYIFRLGYALYNSTFGPYIYAYMLAVSSKNDRHTSLCREVEDHGHFVVWYVPYLEDNYAYFVLDKQSGRVAVVDPADPEFIAEQFEVLKSYVKENLITLAQLKLVCILTTHYHQDHAGGNERLNSIFKGLDIVSGTNETCLGQNISIPHLAYYKLGQTSIQVIDTPCHTIGHVGFFIAGKNKAGAYFSGDTLFVGGCGKFFEGNGRIMYETLANIVLKLLPHDTFLYCGHEYTISNLQFGLKAEPKNSAIKTKLTWAMERRSKRLPTVPSTIADELQHNVFLRYRSPEVLSVLGLKKDTPPETVLGLTRIYKDTGVLPSASDDQCKVKL